MGRIYVSGMNDEAHTVVGTDAREVLTGLDPDGDGRIFYLTNLSYANESLTTEGVMELWDADEGASPTATLQRGSFVVPPDTTLVLGPETFGPDGLPFVTNCVASITGGTVNIGGVLAKGYLG